MRYLCIYKPGQPESETQRPPTEQEMAAMGALIGEMAKAGVLLATEGCEGTASGARLRHDGGKISVMDGPFPETKELIAGYCLMQVKTKAEAIEWGKRFMAVVGAGQCEILKVREAPRS